MKTLIISSIFAATFVAAIIFAFSSVSCERDIAGAVAALAGIMFVVTLIKGVVEFLNEN